jgi:hypothetical protein
LRVEDYFEQMRSLLASSSFVESFSFNAEKRGDTEGFIKSEIKFANGSLLYVREFVSIESGLERDMYSYQYMSSEQALIFRYDNTGHHRKLNLPTFPHHKHDGSEDNVVASAAPLLVDVLQEIAGVLQL